MMKNTLTYLFLIFFSHIFSQNHKGLYVNDFKNIVGNYQKELDLLHFAQDNDYDYLILYNLYYINNSMFDITDSVQALPLANFIEKAKTQYNINKIGGVGETYISFNPIHDYNLDHINTPTQRIDIYNMEFEFWNAASVSLGNYYCNSYLEDAGLPCDTAGAFSFVSKELCRLDSLCNEYEFLNSEIYIGNPTISQCANLSLCADRVLVHFYRKSDTYNSGNSIYNYKKYRIEALAKLNENSIVMPIFNCKSNFMEAWLDTVAETLAYDTWMYGLNGYADDTGTWKDSTTVDGYVWFKYTCMNDTSIHFVEDTTDVTDTILRINTYFDIQNLFLYPNPTNGKIQILYEDNFIKEAKPKIKSVEILNMIGANLLFILKDNIIDISRNIPGNYKMKIVTENGKVYNKNVILKK